MDTPSKESTHNRKEKRVAPGSRSLLIENDSKKDHKLKLTDTNSANSGIFSFLDNQHIMNVSSNIIVLLATICYLISLTGCPHDSQAECLKNFNQEKIFQFAMVLLSSAFLYTLIFNLFIYNKISYWIPIYTTVIIWYLCFVYDTGIDLKSHGYYNRFLLFVLTLVCFIFQNIIVVIILAIRKVGKIKGLIGLVILTLILGATLHYKLVASCGKWRKGLLDTEIDNTLPGCQIKEPKYCWMNLMDNVFDISGWLGENCEQIRMDSREQLIRWTRTPSAKVVGFPRVERWRFFPDSTLNEFQFRVLGSMIDMEDPRVPRQIKDRTEVTVDFRKPHPEMNIRISRDEQLVAKRTQIRNSFKNTNFLAKNVIHLFVDSLSRDNFRRKLPKSKEWLERFYNKDTTDAKVYQFLKYHAIASWTYINMVPTTFGVDGSFQGSPIHNVKYYKEKGFITGQVHNYCGREFYDIEPGNIDKFQFEAFDHEGNLLGCDPNYLVPGHPFAILNGPYGMKRRCLYGRDTSYYAFDYGKKFWKSYADQPKYLRVANLDAHEGTGEVVKYLDDKMVDFLDFLEAEGSLKDTIIILQSDHGMNMPGFYTFVDAEDYMIEKALPALFMIIPQTLSKNYDEIIKDKENLMLSPYDIHNTFLHLAGAPKMAFNKIGKSFFVKTEENERQERTCDKFRVVDPYCQCVGERE